MSIHTTTLDAIDTEVYTSINQTAIIIVSFCNYSAITQTISIHIVPFGDTPSDANIFAKDIDIVAGDTFIVYQGSEKIFLDDGDFISAIAGNASAVTVLTSYVVV